VSSLAPRDCGFSNDLDAPGDDWDIPNIDMELDDLDQASLALGQADQLCLSTEFEGRGGTKQDSQHPDAPALDDEVENRAHRLLRLRGGLWTPECIRNGNQVALPRDQVPIPSSGGMPMLEGSYGPQADPGTEESPSGADSSSGADRSGQDGGMTAPFGNEGELEKEDSEVEEDSQGAEVVRKKRGKKGTGKGKIYGVDKRPKPTRKEATSLITTFMAISSQSHHSNLRNLINQLTALSPSQSNPIKASSNSHIVFRLTCQLDTIDLQTKTFNFHQMVLLMQLALWIDR